MRGSRERSLAARLLGPLVLVAGGCRATESSGASAPPPDPAGPARVSARASPPSGSDAARPTLDARGVRIDLSPPEGFDPVAGEASWRRDDRIAYGMELLRGGERREWFLSFQCLEVADLDGTVTFEWDGGGRETLQVPIGIVRTAAVVREGPGQELRFTFPSLPRLFLERGFFDFCRVHAELTEEESRRRVQATRAARRTDGAALEFTPEESFLMAMRAFAEVLRVLQDDPVLSEVLWQVVEKPSPLALLRTFGRVELTLSAEVEGVRPTAFAAGGEELPAYVLPLVLRINRKPALLLDLTVVRPLPPYHLAGGVVAIDGRAPGKDDTRVEIRLREARRGAE